MKVFVICIEGIHGVGKSTVCDRLREENNPYHFLKEGFLNQDELYGFHEQSLMMESQWVHAWFRNIFRLVETIEKKEGGEPLIIITDRSPYSGGIYAKRNGRTLMTMVKKLMEECERTRNIHILTVCLRRERGNVWKDVGKRLENEPFRKKFKEDDPLHFEYCWKQYYKTYTSYWDYVFGDNFVKNIQEFISKL